MTPLPPVITDLLDVFQWLPAQVRQNLLQQIQEQERLKQEQELKDAKAAAEEQERNYRRGDIKKKLMAKHGITEDNYEGVVKGYERRPIVPSPDQMNEMGNDQFRRNAEKLWVQSGRIDEGKMPFTHYDKDENAWRLKLQRDPRFSDIRPNLYVPDRNFDLMYRPPRIAPFINEADTNAYPQPKNPAYGDYDLKRWAPPPKFVPRNT